MVSATIVALYALVVFSCTSCIRGESLFDNVTTTPHMISHNPTVHQEDGTPGTVPKSTAVVPQTTPVPLSTVSALHPNHTSETSSVPGDKPSEEHNTSSIVSNHTSDSVSNSTQTPLHPNSTEAPGVGTTVVPGPTTAAPKDNATSSSPTNTSAPGNLTGTQRGSDSLPAVTQTLSSPAPVVKLTTTTGPPSITHSNKPKLHPTTSISSTRRSTTVTTVATSLKTSTASHHKSTTVSPQTTSTASAHQKPTKSTSPAQTPQSPRTTEAPKPQSSTPVQAKAQGNNPSELNVGDDSHGTSASLDPLLAGLVAVFVVTAAVVSLVIFLKLRHRNDRPEFRRLQDLPMDDMMEDTPLSMYSY